ncbi:MAG: trypsin-like serine protease [Sulfitobacter sp.]|nr:trypsin-like serine protease [Sulfitobacter sp.]
MIGRMLISGAAMALALMFSAQWAQAQSTSLRKLNTENEAKAWQSVGRLDNARGAYCTGTLITPDLVLTAAHCVYHREAGTLVAPEDLMFQAGLTHGTTAASRAVAQIEAHSGYDPKRGYDLENVRYDLALVRLEAPIPSHELDPFAVFAGQLPHGPVSVVSYGRGRSDQLSRQNECQVLGRIERVVALDCDVTFGSSGAPVFTHLNGRGQIAAVISGGGTYAGKEVAFAMVLPALVADLKRQMRANKPRPKAKVRRLGLGGNKSSTGAKFVTAKGS